MMCLTNDIIYKITGRLRTAELEESSKRKQVKFGLQKKFSKVFEDDDDRCSKFSTNYSANISEVEMISDHETLCLSVLLPLLEYHCHMNAIKDAAKVKQAAWNICLHLYILLNIGH